MSMFTRDIGLQFFHAFQSVYECVCVDSSLPWLLERCQSLDEFGTKTCISVLENTLKNIVVDYLKIFYGFNIATNHWPVQSLLLLLMLLLFSNILACICLQ